MTMKALLTTATSPAKVIHGPLADPSLTFPIIAISTNIASFVPTPLPPPPLPILIPISFSFYNFRSLNRCGTVPRGCHATNT